MARTAAADRRAPTSLRDAAAGREEQPRWAWMDNLRVVVIAGVIVAHAAATYIVDLDWYYEEQTAQAVSQAILGVLFGTAAMFGLAPLFLLAGVLSQRSLAHKGGATFVRDRLVRLGLPLAAYTIVIGPLTSYVARRAEGDPAAGGVASSLAREALRADTGPMWFVAALLVFSVGYAAWRRVRPGPARAGPLLTRHLVMTAAIIVVASFLVRLVWPLAGGTPFHLMLWEWPQSAALFGLGALAGERGWLDAVPKRLWRRCGAVGVAGALGLATVFAVATTSDPAPYAGGWHVQALAEPVAEATLAVAMSIWVFEWFRRLWNRGGRITRSLGRASFAAYVLHPPVLVLLAAVLRPAAVPAEVKFLVVAVLAVTSTFTVGWLATRIRPLARVL